MLRIFAILGVLLSVLFGCSKNMRAIGPEISGTMSSFGALGGIRFNVGEFDEDLIPIIRGGVFYNLERKKFIFPTFYGLSFSFKEILSISWPYFAIFPGFIFGVDEFGRITPTTAVLTSFGYLAEYSYWGFYFFDISFMIGSSGALSAYIPQFWFSTGFMFRF